MPYRWAKINRPHPGGGALEYEFGEMEQYLRKLDFTTVITYSSFQKEIAVNSECELFLFECSAG